MKKHIIMPVIIFCIMLLAGSGAVYALTNEKDEEVRPEQPQTVQSAESTEVSVNSKDETVYILAGTDGSVQKIIVSDWLKNSLGSDELSDKTELADIDNVKGDESYTAAGENVHVWDARGNDIYYQGNIEKDLPVEMSVTYKLDGETISPAELAGKSGKVTIRFDYRNQQYDYAEIDGKKEKVYVPFAMLTGMLLDNDVFTNVEVSSGRLINDGDHTVVVGIAFPGLQDNLGIDSEEIVIPDYVEITADAENFELGMTVTFASNEVFNKIDTTNINLTGDIDTSLGELTSAMEKLMEGSSQLYGGLCELYDKSEELVEGIDELEAGAETLKGGADDLDTGAAKLQSGVTRLSEGLNKVTAKNDELNASAKKIFKSLLANADTRLAAAGLILPKLTISNYDEVLSGVIALLGKSESAKSVIALKASLDDYNKFYRGLQSYTKAVSESAAGAEELKSGANDLKNGTGQLSEGADELHNGILTLKNASPDLVEGIEKLRDGSKELSDGLKKFNDQGIQKLVDVFGGDVEGLLKKLRATIDVSKKYRSFTGIDDDMDGQVKFIYRTDAIEIK